MREIDIEEREEFPPRGGQPGGVANGDAGGVDMVVPDISEALYEKLNVFFYQQKLNVLLAFLIYIFS